MALTVYERALSRPLSRSVDSASITLKFFAQYDYDQGNVYNAVKAVSPILYLGYKRQKISCNPLGAGQWDAEVEYGFSSNSQTDTADTPTDPTDTDPIGPELTFDITAQQQHITQSYKTRYLWKGQALARDGTLTAKGDTFKAGNKLKIAGSIYKVDPTLDGYTPAAGDVGKYLSVRGVFGAWNGGVFLITSIAGGVWSIAAVGNGFGAFGATNGMWGMYTNNPITSTRGLAGSFRQAIGVSTAGVAGTDIFVPHFEFTYSNQMGPMYLPYLRLIRSTAGKVNHAPWRGFDTGEVLYLGCTGTCGPDLIWKLTHKFAVGENWYGVQITPPVSGIPAGGAGDDGSHIAPGITVPFKGAWDYLWVVYQPEAAADGLLQTPKDAYVEIVYQSANLGLLGIGN